MRDVKKQILALHERIFLDVSSDQVTSDGWYLYIFFVIKCEKCEIASRMYLDDMVILGETVSGDYWWGTAEQ